jgi:hypothetical protein
MDARDPICERLGDLAASAAPGDERHPDARQWAAIDQQLDRPSWRRTRRFWPALALSAVAAMGLAGWLVARTPLDYHVQGCRPVHDGARCSTDRGTVSFSDGTHMALDAQTQIRIAPLTFGRGAEIALDDGNATLAVIHRPQAHWAVLAGPFRVEVTGTRFSVRWSKVRQVVSVAVTEGEVHVSGGSLARPTVLGPGQTMQASAKTTPPGPQAGQAILPRGLDEAPPERPKEPATRAPASARAVAETDTADDDVSARPGGRRSASAGREASRRRPTIALPLQGDVRPEPPGTAGSAPVEHEPDGEPAIAPQRPPSGRIVPVTPPPALVVITPDGQLSGAMTGNAWLARGDGTNLSTPVSRDALVRLLPEANGLCTSGTVAGLRCVNENTPSARCNWDTNWGVAIGFHVRADEQAWGRGSPKRMAVEFHGRSTNYRLNAHRKGDPSRKNYCIENYRSGQSVTPSMFKSRCWADEGETLSDFDEVDLFNLQFSSGMQYVAFHYCISEIRLER